MTQLLEKAVARVSASPDREQDALASVLLDELESKRRWDQLFAPSQDLLGLMAREALRSIELAKLRLLISSVISRRSKSFCRSAR
jgi:hypothetical protein